MRGKQSLQNETFRAISLQFRTVLITARVMSWMVLVEISIGHQNSTVASRNYKLTLVLMAKSCCFMPKNVISFTDTSIKHPIQSTLKTISKKKNASWIMLILFVFMMKESPDALETQSWGCRRETLHIIYTRMKKQQESNSIVAGKLQTKENVIEPSLPRKYACMYRIMLI